MAHLLKLNDAGWLFAEGHRTPMHVGLLATFTVPTDRPTFVADLVEGWRECRTFAPPYNYHLRMLPLPSWVELPDGEIDLDYHLRHSALPRPGSQRDLGVLVSRLHSSMMDRRYPLWECHVIEGLEEDKWSLYLKAHHSQIDGVGGVRLLKRILSADPDARGMLPPWSVGTRGADQSGLPTPTREVEPQHQGGLLDQVTATATGALTGGAAVAVSLLHTYAESATGLSSGGRAVPFRAPKSIFNGRIHRPRRFATQAYSVDRLKAVAKAADCSLNDVFLGLCGGAMRRYLDDHGVLPEDPLTANVPVSVREEHGARVGNAITFLYATLGTDIADPVSRLQAIRNSTQLGKERLPNVSGQAMDAYTAALMLPFLSQAILGIGGHGNPASNVVISNVPGPRETRYFDGSRLEQIYPLSLLFNGQALNITAVSYDGQFNIGYTGCRDSIPSLQRIAVYSGEELALLEVALGLGTKPKAPAKKAASGRTTRPGRSSRPPRRTAAASTR